MVNRPQMGKRIVAIAAAFLSALWGLVLALIGAVGCAIGEYEELTGFDAWWCRAHGVGFWTFATAMTLIPAGLVLLARRQALAAESWLWLGAGMLAAGLAPIIALSVLRDLF